MTQHEPRRTCAKNEQRVGNLASLDQEQKDDGADDRGRNVDDGAPSQNIGGARDRAGSRGGHTRHEDLDVRVF